MAPVRRPAALVSNRHYFHSFTFHPEDEVKRKSGKYYVSRIPVTSRPGLWRPSCQDHHAAQFLNKRTSSNGAALPHTMLAPEKSLLQLRCVRLRHESFSTSKKLGLNCFPWHRLDSACI